AFHVTGVQTCALPILSRETPPRVHRAAPPANACAGSSPARSPATAPPARPRISRPGPPPLREGRNGSGRAAVLAASSPPPPGRRDRKSGVEGTEGQRR